MKRALIALIALGTFPTLAPAQDVEQGADLYQTHCATCHGAYARGGGPMAPVLLVLPPDLRNVTARNGGVFPVARVVMRIDGRDPLVSHGSAMPVYGDFFDGQDTPIKAENGQPIMTSKPVADLVAFLRDIQE